MPLALRFRRQIAGVLSGARTRSIIAWSCLVLVLYGLEVANAATEANAESAVGINLQQVNYYSPEQPFLNIFRTSGVAPSIPAQWIGGWLTHSIANGTWDTGEEAHLQVDGNGYPTTLIAKPSDPHSPQLFDSVGVLLLRSLPNSNAGTGPPYRAGRYVVQYDGEGSITSGLDGIVISFKPGRAVINVARPTNAGVVVYITSTDPRHTGNYIRNLRMVKAEEETLLTAGNIFQPTFLDLLRNFRMIRAVQWLTIDNDGGLLTNWSQRPLAADGGWGGHNGVPLEIVLQLCNAVLADCWLNVPHAASDDFIIQMARLVHTNLGASQKVFVEYSNEVWNTEYAQYDYAKLHGMTLWPTGSSVNGNWYGMRAAQTCDMWKSAWGTDASRVVCVMGAQAANVDTAIQALNCPLWIGHSPCARHGIDVVAIAPYINVKGQTTWTSDPDGGLASLFLAMNNTGLPVASRWEADYRAALIPFKIPYIAYESGQSLVGFPTFHDGSAMVNLYIAANRDSRMGAVYASMLNDWRSNGGQSIVIYADIYPPNQYGEWGAVESSLDVVDPLSRAPPKWLAIQTFINTNRCWWPNCRGTIGADSKALPKPH